MKIKSVDSSMSPMAKNASIVNLVAIVQAFAAIPPETRRKIALAMKLDDRQSMSTIPAFMQPLVMYGLTQSFDKPWGYHPYQVDVAASLAAIADKTQPADNRFAIAKILVKHPDTQLHAWIKSDITRDSGFSHVQLVELGLAQPKPVAVTPPAGNVVNADNLISKIMSKFGCTREEAIEFLADDAPAPAKTVPVAAKPAKKQAVAAK